MWKFQTIVIRNHTPCIVNRKTFLTRLNHEIEGVYLYFFPFVYHYIILRMDIHMPHFLWFILIAILSYWCRMFIVLKWAFSFLMKQVDAVYERVVDCAFIYFSFFWTIYWPTKLDSKHTTYTYVHAYIYLYTHYTLYIIHGKYSTLKVKVQKPRQFFFLFFFFRFVSVALCLFSHFLLFFCCFVPFTFHFQRSVTIESSNVILESAAWYRCLKLVQYYLLHGKIQVCVRVYAINSKQTYPTVNFKNRCEF